MPDTPETPKFETLPNVKPEVLAAQVRAEQAYSARYMDPKFSTWRTRMKLYNNQRRDAEKIGDPLIFRVHQTILASLYDDKLIPEFMGGDRSDRDQAENLTRLAEFDATQMNKDMVDYEWIFDASFYGKGYLMMAGFDRKAMRPNPIVLDPMNFYPDPDGRWINGLNGVGAHRFLGHEFMASSSDIRKNKETMGWDVDLTAIKPDSNHSASYHQNESARRAAQGYGDADRGIMKDKTENQVFRLIEWYTWHAGERIKVIFSPEMPEEKSVLFATKLKDQDQWPVIDRAIFPMSHGMSVSIPDLVEDKQRGRSVLQNSALLQVRAGLLGSRLYNKNKIKNPSQLNFALMKNIPVDGDPAGAVEAMPTQQVKQEVAFIMDLLDQSAQTATATPNIQQGQVGAKSRTATELSLVSQGVDTRFSLAAKIFGWSEKRFWKMWYDRYQQHFGDAIDKKVLRITGPSGPTWRSLSRSDLIGDSSPDVKIESSTIANAERAAKLASFQNFIATIAADPSANLRAASRTLGRLSGMHKDEIDMFLPPTIEEMRARDENEALSNNRPARVRVTDDHQAHMLEHEKAKDTPQKANHLRFHRMAMTIARTNPEILPAAQQQGIASEGQGAALRSEVPNASSSPGVPSRIPSTAPAQVR